MVNIGSRNVTGGAKRRASARPWDVLSDKVADVSEKTPTSRAGVIGIGDVTFRRKILTVKRAWGQADLCNLGIFHWSENHTYEIWYATTADRSWGRMPGLPWPAALNAGEIERYMASPEFKLRMPLHLTRRRLPEEQNVPQSMMYWLAYNRSEPGTTLGAAGF